MGGLANRANIRFHRLQRAGFQLANGHDHIQLLASIIQGAFGFVNLDIGSVRAMGKADHCAGFYPGILENPAHQGHILRPGTYRGGMIF